MRRCILDDITGYSIVAKNDKDCIFCHHCNTVWDYANGPYLMTCDLGREEIDARDNCEKHTCEMFGE